MVYLVGAGPGDPGLITVKGLDLVRRADILLFDRLADPSFLAETKPGCLLIDVGKSAGSHTKTQEETTELLVRYGAHDLTVVRLKGGDPFLFGRGGEEAERLSEEGIPFEVVPGVSSLNGVTAYAGIPVTHRDFASSLGVVTGHGASGKPGDPVRWRELARAVDTIVVFMGVGTVENIVAELTAGGLDPSTPAAAIERGTTPLQRVVTGTVASITRDIASASVKPPALLVIGPTASLTDTIAWFNPGPLAGLGIGITRPLAQSKAFVERLASFGARPIPMPTIKTTDTIDTKEVESVMLSVTEYDHLVFSSVNGVNAFFRALKVYGFDVRALAGARICCIGPVTAQACERHGIKADITAERYIAEGLAETLLDNASVAGERFLLVRSDLGRDTLGMALSEAGAIVDDAVFYTTKEEKLSDFALELIENGGIGMITFTSSSTVDGFFRQVKPESLPSALRLASIGPQTSKTIRSYGREPDIEARVYTTDGLADAILDTYGLK